MTTWRGAVRRRPQHPRVPSPSSTRSTRDGYARSTNSSLTTTFRAGRAQILRRFLERPHAVPYRRLAVIDGSQPQRSNLANEIERTRRGRTMSEQGTSGSEVRMLSSTATTPALCRSSGQTCSAALSRLDDDSDAIVRTPSIRLDFLQVPEPKTVKNRFHIDVAATRRRGCHRAGTGAGGDPGRRCLRRRSLAGPARSRRQRVLLASARTQLATLLAA